MFGFLKQKPAPALCPSNPGVSEKVDVGFSNSGGSWSESANLVDLAAQVLKHHGHSVKREKTWLLHLDSKFIITPRFVSLQPIEDGGVQTITTVQVNHPRLTPNGVFEYQHSTGDTLANSIANGFDQWAQMDFVTLLEALRPMPHQCMTLELTLPHQDNKPKKVRRTVLGPVAHYIHQSSATSEASEPEEHPFCPCCLLTKSYEGFRELVEGDSFYCIRLFAARDENGNPLADCRVNGEDWAKGMEALRAYVGTWPGKGYEFRKQYVVLQSLD